MSPMGLARFRRWYSTGKVHARMGDFSMVQAGLRDLDTIVNFLGEHHYLQVPTINCFKVDFMEVSRRLRGDTERQLQDGMSQLIQNDKTGEVVGVSIMHMVDGCLGAYYNELVRRYQDLPARYHWGLLGSVYRDVDLYREYSVGQLLHGRLFCLKTTVQKSGLSNFFVDHLNITADRLFGEGHQKVLFTGESNGHFSNIKMDLLGEWVRSKVLYKDFEMEGCFPFTEVPKTTPHSFVTLRILEFTKPED